MIRHSNITFSISQYTIWKKSYDWLCYRLYVNFPVLSEMGGGRNLEPNLAKKPKAKISVFIFKEHYEIPSPTTTPAAANHTVDNLGCLHSHCSRPVWHSAPTTGKKIQHRRTKHGPRPSAPHLHEPTQHVHYIVIDKQENTCYIHGSLPSAHTPTNFV